MTRKRDPIELARLYLAVQTVAGALWWISVAVSDDVRRLTLGSWPAVWIAVPDLVLFVGASAFAAWRSDRRVAAIAATWTTGVTIALAVDALVRRQAGWGALLMSFATILTIAAAATLWTGRLPRHWFFVGPFSFRPARPASDRVHVRNSLAQLVVFWSTFLLAVPLFLTWVERRIRIDWSALRDAPTTGVGVTLLLLASALGIASCLAMASRGQGTPLPAMTARTLVVAGPYRFVRNPMAVAGAGQTVGVGLILSSWTVIASAVVGSLFWDQFIRPEEEADLAERFGDEYEDYRSSVRCWVPQLPEK